MAEGQLSLEDLRHALLMMMESWSEEYWAASWLIDLEYCLLDLGIITETYLKWVQAVGGWWTHDEDSLQFCKFVEGSVDDLKRLAKEKK